MPKRDKDAKKRAERRERAKARETGELSTDEMVDLGNTGAAQALPAPGPVAPTARRAEKVVEEEPPLSFMEQVEDFFSPMTDFFKEVRIEAKKINWPPRDEAWHSTMVVLFTIVFLATFMGAFSWVAQTVAKRLFSVEGIGQTAAPAQQEPAPTGSLPGTTPGGTTAPPSAPAAPASPGGAPPVGGQ